MTTTTRKKKRYRFKKGPEYTARRLVLLLLVLVIIGGLIIGIMKVADSPSKKVAKLGRIETPSWIDAQLIDVDGHSRIGEKLVDINNIVVHYVGNPGTSAQANRDYFAGTASNVCSHYVVGLEGEIIQCLPLDEYSAATNERNRDTISIEVCHPDDSGMFNDVTYASLVQLTAWLCDETGLDYDDVIRHYDVTGKNCPKYYVENEAAWQQFLTDVKKAA